MDLFYRIYFEEENYYRKKLIENFTKADNKDNSIKIDDSFLVDIESKKENIINLDNNTKKKGKQKETNKINKKSIANKNIYMTMLKGNNMIEKEIINISKNTINYNINWMKYKSNSCKYDAFFYIF